MVNRLRKLDEAGTFELEISEKTGLSPEQLLRLRAAARMRQIQSLDAPFGVEGEEPEEQFALDDVLQSDWIGPAESCQKEDLASTLRKALAGLDPIDRRIVEIVYGFGDRTRGATIGQAARMLRLNPANAKHLMTRAMESLEHIFCAV